MGRIDVPVQGAALIGRFDGPPQGAELMRRFDGPLQGAALMGRFDGPLQGAALMGLFDAPLRSEAPHPWPHRQEVTHFMALLRSTNRSAWITWDHDLLPTLDLPSSRLLSLAFPYVEAHARAH